MGTVLILIFKPRQVLSERSSAFLTHHLHFCRPGKLVIATKCVFVALRAVEEFAATGCPYGYLRIENVLAVAAVRFSLGMIHMSLTT